MVQEKGGTDETPEATAIDPDPCRAVSRARPGPRRRPRSLRQGGRPPPGPAVPATSSRYRPDGRQPANGATGPGRRRPVRRYPNDRRGGPGTVARLLRRRDRPTWGSLLASQP